jgi:hypothetical protein
MRLGAWIAWLPECLVTAARPGRRLRAAVCVACLVQAGAGLCAAPLPCLAARFVCCTAASGLRTPDATPRPRQPAALRHRRRPVTRVLLGLGLGLGLGSQEMPMLEQRLDSAGSGPEDRRAAAVGRVAGVRGSEISKMSSSVCGARFQGHRGRVRGGERGAVVALRFFQIRDGRESLCAGYENLAEGRRCRGI